MGNCLFGCLGETDEAIKVITSNGAVMEFPAPITARSITDEFAGQSIFRSHDHDLFWKPLFHHEELLPGRQYYLLPLNTKDEIVRGHVRSNSNPAASLVAHYRMSCDYQGTLRRSNTDVFSRYNHHPGIWKVKLVISPEQLLEILSQEALTQELIESVRAVSRCGNGVSTSVGFSNQRSLSSSLHASSSKDGLLLDI